MASRLSRSIRYLFLAVLALLLVYLVRFSSSPISGWSQKLKAVPMGVGEGRQKHAHQDLDQKSSHPEVAEKPGSDPTSPATPDTRLNATMVSLARNRDVWDLSKAIRHVEDRFNRKFHYDWVFLNDEPFDELFKNVTSSLVSGTAHYGLIPEEHWSYPPYIDQEKADAARADMGQRNIIYGDSASYRHMCRFESGFFFRHELMEPYQYYWRVEPSTELFCDVDYDPFKFMKDNGKKYSFVISLYEYRNTIATLWDSVVAFMNQYPEHIAPNNSLDFISDDGGASYNLCHFWSNFEIGSLDWLRSEAYLDYFTFLDLAGGFFYERWGDAPVHSIAAALLLDKDEIHFFDDIAYFHVPFFHCPTDQALRTERKCHCNPKDNFDWKGYSCLSRFFDFHDMEKPAGWQDQAD